MQSVVAASAIIEPLGADRSETAWLASPIGVQVSPWPFPRHLAHSSSFATYMALSCSAHLDDSIR